MVVHRDAAGRSGARVMTDAEIDARLAEVDRLLNDPEVRLDPGRVWNLLAALSPALAVPAAPQPGHATGPMASA
jgi:hypothetical protein